MSDHSQKPPSSDNDESGPDGQDGLGDLIHLTPPLTNRLPQTPSSQHAIFAPASLPPTLRKPGDVSAELAYFLSIPWCQAHLQPPLKTGGNPIIRIVQPNSRRAGRPVPDPADGFYRSDAAAGLDNVFSTTLNTPDTLGAFLVFYEEPPAPHLPVVEIKALVHLGPGLNGHIGVSHGGIVATLLDEILGLLIPLNRRRARRTGRLAPPSAHPSPPNAAAATAAAPPEQAAAASAHIELGFVTGYLNTTYLRPVRTSRPVLVTARYTHREGPRKFHVEGSIWDGDAQLLARAEAVFIALKEKL